MYFVYIIQSEKDRSYYTSLTKGLDQRLREHNKSDTKTTRSKKPWRMVYFEKRETRGEVRSREKFLKSGAGREWRDVNMPR